MKKPTDKKKSKSKARAQQLNNKGPCPAGNFNCKHPPLDHRPIAGEKAHFCYGPGCMGICK